MTSFVEEATRIVDPKITASGRALMTRGDPCCEIVFEEVD